MRERLIALRERRAQLVARAAVERGEVAAWLARTDPWVRWAGAGISLLREIRGRPLLIAGAAALLFALRPKRMIGWAMSGWSLWRIARRALRMLAWSRRFAPAPDPRQA